MTTFDLRTLRLRPSDQRRIDREVDLQPLALGGQEYLPEPQTVQTALTVSQAVGGRLLTLRFQTSLSGPCMRCLAPAALGLRTAWITRRVPNAVPCSHVRPYVETCVGPREMARRSVTRQSSNDCPGTPKIRSSDTLSNRLFNRAITSAMSLGE